MFLFIAGTVIALVGIFIFVKREAIADGLEVDTTAWVKLAAGVIAVVGLLMIGGSVAVTVPTRNVAVITAYGKPVGTLHNGFHLIAPWEDVVDYDATVQTLDIELQVRIANGAIATMKTTTHWQIDPNADIQQLHLDWREFSRLQTSVVIPRLQNVLNRTFESYDPLITLKDANGKPQPISSMEGIVKSSLQEIMPKGLIINLVQIPLVQYPPQVQDALNNFQKELAATQVAIQQQKTAEAQRVAIQTLNSVTLSPEAFAMQCLIMTERLAQQGKTISQTWSCVAATAGMVGIK